MAYPPGVACWGAPSRPVTVAAGLVLALRRAVEEHGGALGPPAVPPFVPPLQVRGGPSEPSPSGLFHSLLGTLRPFARSFLRLVEAPPPAQTLDTSALPDPTPLSLFWSYANDTTGRRIYPEK